MKIFAITKENLGDLSLFIKNFSLWIWVVVQFDEKFKIHMCRNKREGSEVDDESNMVNLPEVEVEDDKVNLYKI